MAPSSGGQVRVGGATPRAKSCRKIFLVWIGLDWSGLLGITLDRQRVGARNEAKLTNSPTECGVHRHQGVLEPLQRYNRCKYWRFWFWSRYIEVTKPLRGVTFYLSSRNLQLATTDGGHPPCPSRPTVPTAGTIDLFGVPRASQGPSQTFRAVPKPATNTLNRGPLPLLSSLRSGPTAEGGEGGEGGDARPTSFPPAAL